MTPEKFRTWIIILLAAALATLWIQLGLKTYKTCGYGGYGKSWKKHCMMMDKMDK